MEEERIEHDNSEQVKSEKKKNSIVITVIVFIVLLILIVGIKNYLSTIMPEFQLKQGKKYLEAGQYDRALTMFESARKGLPYSNEPITYKAIVLSKMPITYEVQKALYEIAQLDDCNEASDIAEQAILNMRQNLERKIGPSYIDNVLFEDQLVRWNNSEPITYFIKNNIFVPQYYNDVVRRAFDNWQHALGNQIVFRPVSSEGEAKIVVTFTDFVKPANNIEYGDNLSGFTSPVINNLKLIKMNIDLKNTDVTGHEFNENNLLELAQHEIGHALGIGGHSADSNDVMFYDGDTVNDGTYFKQISRKDINTLLTIYNMIPDVIDKSLTETQAKDMYFHNILTAYPGENFELEIRRLMSMLQSKRSDIVIWVDLAIKYAYKKQFERSNAILNKVFPLAYDNMHNQHVILYNLAANYYKMREYKTAETYLNRAMNYDDDLDTQILEAFIDFKLDRLSIAKDKLTALNRTYPDNIEIALKLSEIYWKLKDKDNEEKVIEKLLKANPNAIRDRRVLKYKANKGNVVVIADTYRQ